jgi:hypothetical protein
MNKAKIDIQIKITNKVDIREGNDIRPMYIITCKVCKNFSIRARPIRCIASTARNNRKIIKLGSGQLSPVRMKYGQLMVIKKQSKVFHPRLGPATNRSFSAYMRRNSSIMKKTKSTSSAMKEYS